MSWSSDSEQISEPAAPAIRWWNSLPFRLTLAVNVAAILLLGTFWFFDSRRERNAHLSQEIERLREEARVLRVAQGQFHDPQRFQRFVDAFCMQMTVAASPGHHIAVFDVDGTVVARAHERAGAALEQKMVENRGAPSSRFTHRGESYVSVRVAGPRGSTIAVAQSLAPLRRIIRAQAWSRAASLGTLAVVISSVTTVVVLYWVHAPLRQLVRGIRAVRDGRFDVRIPPTGSGELRYLAKGVNEMAAALDKVERHRRSQMEQARDIQTRLLPGQAHLPGGFGVAAVFVPTESVGGDLYDIIRSSDGSTLLVVLDVTGHGIPAALYTALLRMVVHYEAKRTRKPAEIMEAMNREFADVAANSGEFATCFLARLDESTGSVEYVSAGHDAGIIVRSDGAADRLEGGGLPLGVEPSEAYSAGSSQLHPGDRLFVYTDGVHEVLGADGRLLGREHLISLMMETRDCLPPDHPRAVLRRVQSASGREEFDDDVTLLCAWRR